MELLFKSFIVKTRFVLAILCVLAPTLVHGQSLLTASQASVSTASVIAETRSVTPGQELRIAIKIDLAKDWHTYWQYPGPIGKAAELKLASGPTIPHPPIRYPKPERIPFAGQTSYGYHNTVTLLTSVQVPETLKQDLFTLDGTLTYLVCKESCLIKEHPFSLRLPVITNGTNIEINPQFEIAVSNWETGGASQLLIWTIILAFIGGLLLNIMPCVLPVLSIKVLHLVEQPSHRRIKNALLYNSGVIGSLLLLFAVLAVLKTGGAQLGWGFQLQSPIIVSALMVLFFIFGLNLFGVFEVVLPNALSRSMSRLGGLGSGAFWSGVFTTIVATPCTAPFMGTAVGIALTQPLIIGAVIFISLGVGLAFPLTLISVIPGFQRIIPKPGPWMVRAKLLLGIPLILSAFWLLWVLGQQLPFPQFLASTAGLALLGIWMLRFGNAQTHRGPIQLPHSKIALGILLLVVSGFFLVPHLVFHGGLWPGAQSDWREYSPELVNELEQTRQPYFIDFTAAWCVTCQYNKRRTLNKQEVKDAFRSAEVTLIRANWTNRNATIAQALETFDRATVPLYVFHSGSGEAVVLPTIITPEDIFVLTSSLSKP